MRIFSTCLLTHDPLGRVNLENLSQQQRMELLIQGLSDCAKQAFRDENGDFLPVCEWMNIDCNMDGKVEGIMLKHNAGNLNLDFTPPTVRLIDLKSDHSLGVNSVNNLPESIEVLLLNHVCIDEPMKIASLPRALQFCTLEACALQGTCDFTAFPDKLENFRMPRNECHGNVRLDALPASIYELNISFNEFSGELNLEHLPSGLAILILRDNAFTGSIVMLHPPGGIGLIDLQENQLSGTAQVKRALIDVLLMRSGNCIEAAIDENGAQIEEFY